MSVAIVQTVFRRTPCGELNSRTLRHVLAMFMIELCLLYTYNCLQEIFTCPLGRGEKFSSTLTCQLQKYRKDIERKLESTERLLKY